MKSSRFFTRASLVLIVFSLLATPPARAQQAASSASCLWGYGLIQKVTDTYTLQKAYATLKIDPAQAKVYSANADENVPPADSTISPDGHYNAFWQTDNEKQTLIIRAVNSLDSQPINMIHTNLPGQAQGNGIVWSPSSHWLATSWDDDQGNAHFDVADIHQQQHEFILPTTFPVDLLNGLSFSFDDKYIVLQTFDNDSQKTTLSLRSIPDLTLVNSAEVDQPTPLITQWSPLSDSLAYIGKDQSGLALFILTPTGKPQKITTLSDPFQSMADTDPIGIGWSPHERYITLVKPPLGDQLGVLDLVNVQSHEIITLSKNYWFVGMEGGSLSFLNWSPDGMRLFFSASPDGQPSLTIDLMVYDFNTKQVSTVVQSVAQGDVLKNRNWLWVAHQLNPDDPTQSGLWHEDLIDMRTGKPLPLIDGEYTTVDGLVSPDAQSVIGWYVTQQQWGLRWVRDAETSVHQYIAGRGPLDDSSKIDMAGISLSQWSANSRYVTFEASGDIGLLDVTTGAIQIIKPQADMLSYASAYPSSDGKWLAVTYFNSSDSTNNTMGLKILSADGTQAFPVLASTHIDSLIWSPDSRWLAVQLHDSIDILKPDGTLVLQQQPQDGSEQEQIDWEPCGG